LETREYASMLLRGAAPQDTEAQHEELLGIRLRRQEVLSADREHVAPLGLHVILDEGALHRGPDEGSVMADQMRELHRRSECDNVDVQIFPFSAGYSEALSMFSIFEPRDPGDSTVVCVESTARDAYYDGAIDLKRYRAIWDDLTLRAADVDKSRELIAGMAEARERDARAER
jgi:hypothetical protein